MKRENMANNHSHISDHLRRLPRKMLTMHGLGNMTEFVLHELCSKSCFGLHKAAYFIDNPDFDCIKGVAGISYEDVHDIQDIWQSPDIFTQHMINSAFNNKVRSVLIESHKKNDVPYEQLAKTIANDLGLDAYKVYSWDMKHNNHGLLVCEKHDIHDNDPEEDLVVDGLSLLSFCPVH